MDDKLKRLESKIDRLDERLDSIDKTLVKQEENLKLHMYRTELAEKAIGVLASELKPVKTHVAHVEGVVKYIGYVSLLVGIAAGIVEIFKP